MGDKKRDPLEDREWGITGGVPQKYSDPAERIFIPVFALILGAVLLFIFWKISR